MLNQGGSMDTTLSKEVVPMIQALVTQVAKEQPCHGAKAHPLS